MTPSGDLLHTAIKAIYDAAADPLQWPRALGVIADLFGDAGAIIEWQKSDKTYGVVVSESLARANRDFAENNWSQHNFKGELATKLGFYFNGVPFTDRHLCSEDEMCAHPFSTDFLFKHGLGRFAGVSISPDPQVGVLLSLQRSFADKPPFSDAELELIGVIGHHMEKSLRLSIRLLDSELVNLGMGDALARIGIGVFALDSLGRVVFSNPAGQSFVGDLLDIVDDRLRLRVRAARTAFDEAVARTLQSRGHEQPLAAKPVLLHSATSERRLVVYILPVTTHLEQHFLTQTRAIVLAIEQKAGEPADPAAVRDVLGLTLGEARVAALIGAGMRPREAAERLGIAEETARSHLRSVFGKVGVSRQSELVALLTKLMLR